MSVNNASRTVIGDFRVILYIVAPFPLLLIDDSSGVIYDRW
jgi:hypothetical protein